jgi:hypothetical protein
LANEVDRPARVRAVLDVISRVPHVRSTAAALAMPAGNWSPDTAFWKSRGIDGSTWAVSGGIFETIGTPILAGRSFTEDEVDAASLVALVSEAGAYVLWPGEDARRAVHRTIQTTDGTRIVVGVVADIRHGSGEPARPSLFLPITAREARLRQSALEIALRMAPGAIPDFALMRARLNERFAANAVSVESVAAQVTPVVERPRFLAVIFGSLAAMALLLAAFGLFAVTSVEVARRRWEIGVRLALGASRRDVRRRIFGIALVPVVLGAAAGLLATWWGASFLQGIVTEVDARDPWAYAGALILMLATAIVAAWLPARRAARIESAAILREP